MLLFIYILEKEETGQAMLGIVAHGNSVLDRPGIPLPNLTPAGRHELDPCVGGSQHHHQLGRGRKGQDASPHRRQTPRQSQAEAATANSEKAENLGSAAQCTYRAKSSLAGQADKMLPIIRRLIKMARGRKPRTIRIEKSWPDQSCFFASTLLPRHQHIG